MRVFKYLFFALLFLVIAFFAYGYFFLEDKVQVSRSITIDRPAKMVFKVINSMHRFNEWSPWAKYDPDAKYIYEGPDKGVGSKMSWVGNEKMGSGNQEIIESIPHEKVRTLLYFDGQGDDPSWATYQIEEQGDSVNVSWTLDTDFKGNILSRYFGMMLDKMVGPEYEAGLANLKTLVEAQTVYDFSNFTIEAVTAQNILYVTTSGNIDEDISAVIAKAYAQITQFMTANGIEFAGMPLTITHDFNNQVWEFDAAIPVSIQSIEGETGDIHLGQTYAGKAIKYLQMGPYDQGDVAYNLIAAYMEEHELVSNGKRWEVYANDPTTVTEAEIMTYIYQPIK